MTNFGIVLRLEQRESFEFVEVADEDKKSYSCAL